MGALAIDRHGSRLLRRNQSVNFAGSMLVVVPIVFPFMGGGVGWSVVTILFAPGVGGGVGSLSLETRPDTPPLSGGVVIQPL